MVSIHDNSKFARFECRLCSKRIFSEYGYRKHIKNHPSMDPHRAMILRGECFYPGCGKTYSGNNPAQCVKYHLVTVHRDRNYAKYECKECDKLFHERGSWRRHMKGTHDLVIELTTESSDTK